MEIEKEKNEAKLIIKLSGNLNSITSEELEDALDGALDDITELIFDFDKLQYITSAGIRVLTTACLAMSKKGSMKIINAKKNQAIYEVFKITNLLEAFNVE